MEFRQCLRDIIKLLHCEESTYIQSGRFYREEDIEDEHHHRQNNNVAFLQQRHEEAYKFIDSLVSIVTLQYYVCEDSTSLGKMLNSIIMEAGQCLEQTMTNRVMYSLSTSQVSGLLTRAACMMKQLHDASNRNIHGRSGHEDDDDEEDEELHILQLILSMVNECVGKMNHETSSLDVINTTVDAMTALKIPLEMIYRNRSIRNPRWEPALLYDIRFFIGFLLQNFFKVLVRTQESEETETGNNSRRVSVRTWLQKQSTAAEDKPRRSNDLLNRNSNSGCVAFHNTEAAGRNGAIVSLSPAEESCSQRSTMTTTTSDSETLILLLDKYGKDLIKDTLGCLPSVKLVETGNEMDVQSTESMNDERHRRDDEEEDEQKKLVETTELVDLAVDFLLVMESEPILSCTSSPLVDDARKLWCAITEFALYKMEGTGDSTSQECHKIIINSMRRLIDSQRVATETYDSVVVRTDSTTAHGANLNKFEQSMIISTVFRLMVGAKSKEELSMKNKRWVARLLETERYGPFLKSALRSSAFLLFCSPYECEAEEGNESIYYHILELAGLEDEETELDQDDPNYDPFHSYILQSLSE
jgi:hypothetical protein